MVIRFWILSLLFALIGLATPEIALKQDIPEEWFHLTKQPVAILGNGKSGQGAHTLLQKIGWDSIIYDQTENIFHKSDAGKYPCNHLQSWICT